MAFQLLSEAILRIEHKLDALLKHLSVQTQPMHFVGQGCPVCFQSIEYVVDITKGIVVRKCQCSTGKYAPGVPLVPLTQPLGDVNGNDADQTGTGSEEGEAPRPKNRRRS